VLSPFDTTWCINLCMFTVLFLSFLFLMFVYVIYGLLPEIKDWWWWLTSSHNESRHLIGRTTTVLHRRYRLLLEFNIIVASPFDMECRPSRLLIPVLWCFWFQIFWRHSTLKTLPFQSLWSYGHGALQVRVPTLLLPHYFSWTPSLPLQANGPVTSPLNPPWY